MIQISSSQFLLSTGFPMLTWECPLHSSGLNDVERSDHIDCSSCIFPVTLNFSALHGSSGILFLEKLS